LLDFIELHRRYSIRYVVNVSVLPVAVAG